MTIAWVSLFFCLGESVDGKEWKTKDGYSLHGEFVSSRDGMVSIRTSDSGLIEVRRDRLTEEDLKFLAVLEKIRSEIGLETWPRQIQGKDNVRLVGGPRVYRTRHFEIDVASQQKDRSVVILLATVMEDTLLAISGIPTGLELKPPAPANYFKVRLMDRVLFDREFDRVGLDLILPTNQRVRGAYIARKRELWLPLEAGSNIADLTPTMVHEVCHQAMHEWLPLLPVWFLEGFAEYMASIPYELRSFRFNRANEGLRRAIAFRYRAVPEKIRILHPGKLIAIDRKWNNRTGDYLSSLMLIYYLIHLDGSGNGSSFKHFVNEIARSRDQTDVILEEIRTIADTYNSRVKSYREEVIEYHRRVEQARIEMRSGSRAYLRSQDNGRLIIAGTSEIPDPPRRPGEAPLEVISREREKVFNLITGVNQRAILAMLGNRSLREFAAQMKEDFEKEGLKIHFY